LELKVIRAEQNLTLQTTAFKIGPLPDTPDIQQSLIVLLREFHDSDNHPLFTHQTLAQIVSSSNRQAASEHCEQFRASGRELLPFLQRRRKVDSDVVAAVEAELEREPLISCARLVEQVNAKMNRSDLTLQNIDTALDQVSCRVTRQALGRLIETGQAHWAEQPLLEAAMKTLAETSTPPERTSLLEKFSASGITAASIGERPSSDTAKTPPDSVVIALLTPGGLLNAIPLGWQLAVFCLTLFYWGVPLSRLGAWLGVNKTTVLRHITGLALALWPPIQGHICFQVTAAMIYVDEKWLKIRGRWHYWFVALDAATELPVVSFLSPKRNHWACRWVFVSLKQMGKAVAVVVTDGLAAYDEALAVVFANAKHVLCLFHYKQAVANWLKRNLADPNKIKKAKALMKGLVNTVDPRTMKRRLSELTAKAAELGIENWLPLFTKKMSALIPAIRRNNIPTTTNAIERFFRAFNRFYKTKGSFFTVESAGRELILFMVVYVFIIQPASGRAPIEAVWPEAVQTPFYRMANNPLLILAQPEMSDYLNKNKTLAQCPELEITPMLKK